MANINICIMAGNLTDAPKVKAFQSGMRVAEFSVAVHRRLKDKDEDVCFIPVTVWGKIADVCERYLAKGSGVMVRGYLKQDVWDGDDGKRHTALKLVADEVQFLGGKGKDLPPQQQQQQMPPPQSYGQPPPALPQQQYAPMPQQMQGGYQMPPQGQPQYQQPPPHPYGQQWQPQPQQQGDYRNIDNGDLPDYPPESPDTPF